MKTALGILLALAACCPVFAGRTFNGTTDRFQAVPGGLLIGGSQATIVCAFKVSSLPGASEIDICSNGAKEGSGHQGPVMVQVGSTFYGAHFNSIGVTWWQSTPLNHNVDLFCAGTISTNTWYTVVSTFDSGFSPGAFLWVNGALCSNTGSPNGALAVQGGGDTPDFCAGSFASSGGACNTANFAGTVANFYIYSTAFQNPGATGQPIGLALSLVCPSGITARRMGFPNASRAWPLAGISGASIEPDFSGHVGNGSLTGTTATNDMPPCTP